MLSNILNFSNLSLFNLNRMKEIPDELKIVENVFDATYKQKLESDPNRFLIAEKNGIPIHCTISSNNLKLANDNYIFFYDIEDLLKLVPRGVENHIEDHKGFIDGVVRNVSKNFQWSNIKEFRHITNMNEDGFTGLSKEEMKSREIKLLTFNSLGKIVALVNKNNLLIFVNLFDESNNLFINVLDGKFYNPKITHLEEVFSGDKVIRDIQWHSVEHQILLLAYNDRILFLKVNSDLNVCIYKKIELSNITKIKFSNSGESLVIIHNHGKTFSILDSGFNIIYSKTYLLDKIEEVTFAPNSTFFILHTKYSLYLFNSINLSFKSWTDFLGEINNVIVSEDSNNIFVFTNDLQCPIYIIYNMTEDFYNFSYNERYNNIPQYYLHTEYKISFKLFSLMHSENKTVVKARMNSLNNRLVVLFRDSEVKKNEVKLFEITKDKSAHETRINFICSVNNFREMEVSDFELTTNVKREDILLLLWNDKILSKTYLNPYNFNTDSN